VLSSGVAPFELRIFAVILCRHRNRDLHHGLLGVRRFDLLEQAVRRAGADKVLFGSDGPWLHPGLELQKIRLLNLGAQEAALVLGGNVPRLIGRVRTSPLARQRPPAAPVISLGEVTDPWAAAMSRNPANAAPLRC
jgi:hypothetical protein